MKSRAYKIHIKTEKKDKGSYEKYARNSTNKSEVVKGSGGTASFKRDNKTLYVLYATQNGGSLCTFKDIKQTNIL